MKITPQKQVDTVPAKATPYGLGKNLYLDVKGENARAWLFIWKTRGKNEYAGLGSASGSKGHKVSLAEARRKADQYRSLISQGKDPRQEERRPGLTLRDAVKAYVDRHNSQWRSATGEKHWHGAAPETAMTHIAIQESLDGKAVDWLEHVSDEEYGRC